MRDVNFKHSRDASDFARNGQAARIAESSDVAGTKSHRQIIRSDGLARELSEVHGNRLTYDDARNKGDNRRFQSDYVDEAMGSGL